MEAVERAKICESHKQKKKSHVRSFTMHLSVYRDALRAAGLRPAIKAWWKDRQVRLAFFKSEYVDKIGEMYTQNPFILAYIATPVSLLE